MEEHKQWGSFIDAINFYKGEYLKYLDMSKRLAKENELLKRECKALEQDGLLKCERIEQLERELKGVI